MEHKIPKNVVMVQTFRDELETLITRYLKMGCHPMDIQNETLEAYKVQQETLHVVMQNRLRPAQG